MAENKSDKTRGAGKSGGMLDGTAELAKDALTATGGAATTAARKIAALTDVGPFGGFKKFISRGSMIDMAVGVVMGSAVTAVVNAIVDNLINPLIAAIGGQPDMSGILNITLPHHAVISFGAILDAILNFLLIGVAVYFCVILPINKLRDMTAAVLEENAAADAKDAEAKEPAGPSVEERTLAVLEEIRDELRRVNATSADGAAGDGSAGDSAGGQAAEQAQHAPKPTDFTHGKIAE